MDIEEILREIIREARDGCIYIDGEEFYIGFNTKIEEEEYINDKNSIMLNIKKMDSFIKILEEYILLEKKINRKRINYLKDRDVIKSYIIYLLSNASTEDFNNIESYTRRYINYLKDNTLEEYDMGKEFFLEGILENEKIRIVNKKQSIMMETPNKIEISIVNKDNNNLIFKLPEISYGIENDTCYIYSILNKEDINKDDNIDILKYKKYISRLLYKLNKDILLEETNEYKNNPNNIDNYYIENITDVSVSAVLSLYIFINIIKDKVNKIKGVTYLPLRYISRENASLLVDNIDRREELDIRNNKIQKNLTDKFIRTFRRVERYIDDFNIISYPYELDEYITCSTLKIKKDTISNDIIDSINIRR